MLDDLAKVLFFQRLTAKLGELGLNKEDYQCVMSNSLPMVRFTSPDIDINNIAVQLSSEFFPSVIDDFVDPENVDNFELVIGFAPGFRHAHQYYHGALHLSDVVGDPSFQKAVDDWFRALFLNSNDLDKAYEIFYYAKDSEDQFIHKWVNPNTIEGFDKFVCFWMTCDQKEFPIPDVKANFDPSMSIKQLVEIYRTLLGRVSTRIKSIADD